MTLSFQFQKLSRDFPLTTKVIYPSSTTRNKKSSKDSTRAISVVAIIVNPTRVYRSCLSCPDDVFLLLVLFHSLYFLAVDDVRMPDLSVVLLDGGLEGDRVGADDLADLLAVLEDEESGHGADVVVLGGLGDLVDVNLVEAGVGVVVREPVGKNSC